MGGFEKMGKRKALKNQVSEFRKDIPLSWGGAAFRSGFPGSLPVPSGEETLWSRSA